MDTRVTTEYRIVEWDEKYAGAFISISLEWLKCYGLLEEGDERVMYHPHETVLDLGGQIWFAVKNGEAVGTVAAIPIGNGKYELGKLGVTDSAAGHGIGRKLTETALSFMAEKGAKKVILFSNSALGKAIGMYERMGFRHVVLGIPEFESADVKMEMDPDVLRQYDKGEKA